MSNVLICITHSTEGVIYAAETPLEILWAYQMIIARAEKASILTRTAGGSDHIDKLTLVDPCMDMRMDLTTRVRDAEAYSWAPGYPDALFKDNHLAPGLCVRDKFFSVSDSALEVSPIPAPDKPLSADMFHSRSSGTIFADADPDTLFGPSAAPKSDDPVPLDLDTIDKFLYTEFSLTESSADYDICRRVLEAWITKDINLDNPE